MTLQEPDFGPHPVAVFDQPPPEFSEARARYQVRCAADALQPQPPTEYIVDKMIVSRSVNVFYGEPGSKKTYSLLSMAVCVAAGLPWLGFAVKQARVLIVDEESGESRLSKRLGAALRGENCGPETPISYVSLAGFKLDNPEDRDELRELIIKTGAELVIIDALTDVMDGDENSKQDVQPVFTACRKIAEDTGAAIIIIHHSNRSGGYRGSSAIKGAIEIMVQVTSEEESNTVNFDCEKNRDGQRQKWGAVATWIDWDTPEECFTLKSYSIQEKEHFSKSQLYVLRYLEEHGNSAVSDIEAAADVCTSNAARQAIYNLTSRGKIYRTNPGEKGKGSEAFYDLRGE